MTPDNQQPDAPFEGVRTMSAEEAERRRKAAPSKEAVACANKIFKLIEPDIAPLPVDRHIPGMARIIDKHLTAALKPLREELADKTAALCTIKDRISSSDDFSADEIIEYIEKRVGKYSQGIDWIREKVIEEVQAENKSLRDDNVKIGGSHLCSKGHGWVVNGQPCYLCQHARIEELRIKCDEQFIELTALRQRVAELERANAELAQDREKEKAVYEIVDASDEETYWTLGTFLNVDDALAALSDPEPPVDDDGQDAVVLEVRSRPIGFHPHAYNTVASRTWVRQWDDEEEDASKWDSRPIVYAARAPKADGEGKRT